MTPLVRESVEVVRPLWARERRSSPQARAGKVGYCTFVKHLVANATRRPHGSAIWQRTRAQSEHGSPELLTCPPVPAPCRDLTWRNNSVTGDVMLLCVYGDLAQR